MHIRHCRKCGNLLTGRQRKYCTICQPIAEAERERESNKRYRKRHHKKMLRWEAEYRERNKEQIRLNGRNFIHRNKEKCREALKKWRKENPEKYKIQRQREWKRRKRRLKKRMYMRGIYPPKVKRGAMHISICRACGREIENRGRGKPRDWCESCFPQIMALKRVLHQIKNKEKNPNHFKEYYRETKEVIVASTCEVCNAFILYKGRGMVPHLCEICGPFREINAAKRREVARQLKKMTIEEYIKKEKKQSGLDGKRKWTAKEINRVFERWKGIYCPQPISYDEVEYSEE